MDKLTVQLLSLFYVLNTRLLIPQHSFHNHHGTCSKRVEIWRVLVTRSRSELRFASGRQPLWLFLSFALKFPSDGFAKPARPILMVYSASPTVLDKYSCLLHACSVSDHALCNPSSHSWPVQFYLFSKDQRRNRDDTDFGARQTGLIS
jgi:hypothetical protein